MHYQSPILSKFQWALDIDLLDDYRTIVYNDLQKAGYTDVDKEHAIYQYFNLRKRKIDRRPRHVFRSKEFSCPVGYEKALREFEDKVKAGADLTPFQSEKIKETTYNDLLLYDWNIQHFHLTRRFRDDGFAQRSQYQIFAYVTDEEFYMIQAYPHNEDDLYSKQEMVRILKDNWTEVMERFHLKDIKGLVEKLDDHQYNEIRKAHITTFVDLGPNEVYGMIGGGYVSNGLSNDVVRSANFWKERIMAFQNIAVNHADWIGKSINEQKGRKEAYCTINLKYLWCENPDLIILCETISGLILQINTKESWLRICKPFEVFG